MNINQNNNNINFKGNVPLRVFVDGMPAASESQVSHVVNTISKALSLRAKEQPLAHQIVDQFRLHDAAFCHTDGTFKIGAPIKLVMNDNLPYLFTGPNALEINKILKSVGIQKKYELKLTKAEKAVGPNYIKTLSNLISKIDEFIFHTPKIQLREFFNPHTRLYSGKEVDLVVMAKQQKKTGKEGSELVIEDLFFKEKSDSPIQKLPPRLHKPKSQEFKPTMLETQHKASESKLQETESHPIGRMIKSAKKKISDNQGGQLSFLF